MKTGTIPGIITASATGASRLYFPSNSTLQNAYFYLGTLSGATGPTIQIMKNGSTSLNGATGTYLGSNYTAISLSSTAMTGATDYLIVSVNSAGSGASGYLTIEITYTVP